MAYDRELADRVREQLAGERGVTEKAMFGRLMFLLDGHLVVGVAGDELLVRVGDDAVPAALEDPHVRAAQMGGRTMKHWVLVSRDGDIADRVRRAIDRAVSQG
jgi:TfoX/Sxy family transcriptional regulator of competence genes